MYPRRAVLAVALLLASSPASAGGWSFMRTCRDCDAPHWIERGPYPTEEECERDRLAYDRSLFLPPLETRTRRCEQHDAQRFAEQLSFDGVAGGTWGSPPIREATVGAGLTFRTGAIYDLSLETSVDVMYTSFDAVERTKIGGLLIGGAWSPRIVTGAVDLRVDLGSDFGPFSYAKNGIATAVHAGLELDLGESKWLGIRCDALKLSGMSPSAPFLFRASLVLR